MPNPIPLASVEVGSGEPVVLLHAFPLSHEIWQKIHPPAGFKLILPDFPGFGLSPLGLPGFTLEEGAKTLEKHLRDKGLNEPFHLGGISMGGYWALEYLRQFPMRVKSLFLISTKTGVDKPEAKQNRLNMAEKVLQEGTEYLVGAMTPGLLGKTTLARQKDVVETLARWIREADPQAVALAQRAMAVRRDQTKVLAETRPRTYILAGREDALIPVSEAQAMAIAVPKSRSKILEGVGHLIPLEDPVQFENILTEFLTK